MAQTKLLSIVGLFVLLNIGTFLSANIIPTESGAPVSLERRTVNKQNGTVNWLLENLVDYGFYWIGVGAHCREHAVCLSARDFGRHFNAFVSEDKLVSVPKDVLGNHDLTYAWLIGMQSTDSEICHQMYQCTPKPTVAH